MWPAAAARPSTVITVYIQVVELAVIALVAVTGFLEESAIAPLLGLVAGAVRI